MSQTITIYGIPNCDTVKKSRAWFDAHSLAYDFHDFKKNGVNERTLREWIKRLGWQSLVNTKGTTWRKLDEAVRQRVIDGASALELMLEHSSVIKRPVVVVGSAMTVGYCPQDWLSTALTP